MQQMSTEQYNRKDYKRNYGEQRSSSALSGIRIPPQNLDSERALLGALLIRAETLYEVSDILQADGFYAEKHRIIYQAMLDLHERREPIDLLTMSAKLSERGQFDQIGGHTYLTELTNVVPSSANARHYADIIHRKHVLRKLISGAEQISELGFQEDRALEEVLDEAESTIFKISKMTPGQAILNMKDGAREAWERFEKISEQGDGLRGVPTGFPSIDKTLSGLQPSDLIILAARPSMGKTSLVLDIIRGAAVKNNIPVGMFSLEMSAQQIIDRMVSAESRIDAWRLRTGKLSRDNEFEFLREGIDRLSKAPIYINDQAGINIMNMRSTARRMVSEYGVKMIVVDYLQLMSPMRQSDSQVQIVTEISRSLKGLAKDLNVPVIALSQLSRDVEKRGGKPKLSDLRDSGSIEQDADIVMFIHRETDENHLKNEETEILIEKHRNGATGVVKLHFDSKHTSFREIDGNHGGYSGKAGDDDFDGF
jgi:replicative DNA helicase